MPPPEELDAEEAVLVDTGSFRVDRKQALSKLMRFQLPDPGMYLLLLVRCAVASGATYVRIEGTEGSGVRVRFNGRPFDSAAVENPYASLFSRTSTTARRDREFAIALLTMLRLGPKWVTLQSGEGKARFVLRVESLETESIQPAADGSAETVIRAVPRGSFDSSFWNDRLSELVRRCCDLSPIPVELDGLAIPRRRAEDSTPETLPFDADGVRGFLTLPSDPGSPSEFRLYRCGVWVADVRERLPFIQVSGSVNCDLFSLNASQSGVLRNERLRKSLSAASKQVERLILRVAEFQNAAMAHTGRYLLTGALHDIWKERLPEGGHRETGVLATLKKVFATPLEPDLRGLANTVAQDAQRTRWMREAASRLAGAAGAKIPEPVRKAVLECGLFLGADARPMSLADILSQRERVGYVPVTERPFPETKIAFMPVWITSQHDILCMRPWAGESLSSVTGYLESEERRWQGTDPSLSRRKPSFELLGVVNILTRLSVPHGGLEGEIALAGHRPADGARIHVFRDSGAVSNFRVEGPLRFVAVLPATPAGFGEEQAAAFTAGSAPPLYRRAAAEYHPDWDLPRNNALREHLIDFLAWVRGSGKDPLTEHPWAAAARIFQHDGGLWSYSQLQQALSNDETLFFTRDPSKRIPVGMLFRGERFSLESLRSLFPHSGASAYPGAEGVSMVYPRLACQDHGGECLVEADGVHLAAGAGERGSSVSRPWGICRAFGKPCEVSDEAGLALLLAVLRGGRDELWTPRHPSRRFLLQAVRHFFAPWPGKDLDSPTHRRLREVLAEYPLFRKPDGSRWTLRRLDSRMDSGRELAYSDDPARADVEILLDEEELAEIRALFPGSNERLGAAKKAAPRPIRSLKEESRKQAELSFPSPMLCQAHASAQGIDLLVGLPPEPLPGLEVTVLTASESLRFSLSVEGLSMAGALLIDARTYKGPVEQAGALHPDLAAVVLPVYQRFVRGILDNWTSLSRTEGLFAYLLLLLQPTKQECADPAWAALRREIRGLKALPTLGGDLVSLDDLAAQAVADGALVYSVEALLSVPEDGRRVPLLRYPRLTAQALGDARLRKYAPAPPAQEPAAPVPAEADASPEERIVSRLSRIFSQLRGTHGIDPQGCPAPEALGFTAEGEGLFPIGEVGGWKINTSHPRVAEVLASGLPPEEQADFLASIIYSEGNRGMRSITDREDLEFQTALAEKLLVEISCRTTGRPT